MAKFVMPGSMKVATIWVVWAFLSIGALGWALFVVLSAFGVERDMADWVQALGSVAAIIAAGFFPIWHEKIKEKGELLRLESLIRELALHHQLNLEGLERALEKGLDQQNYIALSVVGSRLVHFWPGHLEALQSIDVSKLNTAHLNGVNTMKADVRLILDFLPLLPTCSPSNFKDWVSRRVAITDALDWISQIRKTL